jgi:hypothetical protein
LREGGPMRTAKPIAARCVAAVGVTPGTPALASYATLSLASSAALSLASAVALALASAALVLAPNTAAAETYVVNAGGTGDFPTIQAAVDSADAGDIIELTDETFTGPGNRDVVVPAIDITIRSQGGDPMQCVIDCEGSGREEHRGFHFEPGDASPWLRDVAVINGYTTTGGAGVWIEGVDAVLLNCIVAFCTAEGDFTKGGGLYVSDGANVFVSGCRITSNHGGYGAGVSVFAAQGSFEDCVIGDNVGNGFQGLGGGAYTSAGGHLEFTRCEIVSNSAPRAGGIRMYGDVNLIDCVIARNEALYSHSGGIWLQGGDVIGCTVVENSAASGGAGVHCEAGSGDLYNSIVAFNGPGYGVAALEGHVPNLSCCDVYGNPDGNYDATVGDQTGIGDNFSVDPEFCWFEEADYRLYDTSDCLPGESPCGALVGAYGQACDSPIEGTSWGKVKALYR